MSNKAYALPIQGDLKRRCTLNLNYRYKQRDIVYKN
jgi:hypothetical protein